MVGLRMGMQDSTEAERLDNIRCSKAFSRRRHNVADRSP